MNMMDFSGTGTQAHQLSDLDMAQQLMHTCYAMYRLTPTGLAPELVHFVEHDVNRSQAFQQDAQFFAASEVSSAVSK